LLVGKMSHGTVIEVATWRGTGRPDSRTNRLMLGMSSSESDPNVNSAEAEEDLVIDKRSIKYWIWLVIQISKKIRAVTSINFTKVKGMFTKNSSEEHPVANVTVEDDVQAWLDNIKSKSPNPSSTKVSSPTASRSSKSPAKPTKSTKKLVKKSNSGKKG
jgi:ribosomal protein S16